MWLRAPVRVRVQSEEQLGYADGWPLDAVSVEAFSAVAIRQPFMADYGSSHVLFYKLQQLSDTLNEADHQSLYSPQLLEKNEQNKDGLCLLLRVLDAENLFHNSQNYARSGLRSARKSMELNPYVKVYMVTSTAAQLQEQAVCSRVFRNDSNPHFDQYLWLWLADAGDTSGAWKHKLVHIEIWHKADIGADVFLGGKILQLNGQSPATHGLSLRKGCCAVTTVELNSLAEQHAEMRRIKEQFFGRALSPKGGNEYFDSDDDDDGEALLAPAMARSLSVDVRPCAVVFGLGCGWSSNLPTCEARMLVGQSRRCMLFCFGRVLLGQAVCDGLWCVISRCNEWLRDVCEVGAVCSPPGPIPSSRTRLCASSPTPPPMHFHANAVRLACKMPPGSRSLRTAWPRCASKSSWCSTTSRRPTSTGCSTCSCRTPRSRCMSTRSTRTS